MKSLRHPNVLAIAWALLFSVMATGAVKADVLQTYDLVWSGASFQNSATATGQITLDLTTLPNPQSDSTYDMINDIVSLSVTVSNDGAGNGTWTKADLAPLSFLSTNTYWGTGGSLLDMTTELVGQPTTGGGTWGTPNGLNGDFNLFFSGGPEGSFYFTLSTALGDAMLLTNFTPVATPLPAALPLFATGLGALGLLGWRRKKKAQMNAA